MTDLPRNYDMCMASPPDPPKYVRCHGCGYDVEFDKAVWIEERDDYFCEKCAACESCHKQTAVRLCPMCDAFTCADCLREYDHGVDRETGYHDKGVECAKCVREVALMGEGHADAEICPF